MQKLLSAAFLLLIPSPVFAALTINIAPQAGSSTNLQVGDTSNFVVTLDFADSNGGLVPNANDILSRFDIVLVENGLGGTIDFGSINVSPPGNATINLTNPSSPRISWERGAAPATPLVNNASIQLATFTVTATGAGDVQLRLRENNGQTGGNPNPDDNPNPMDPFGSLADLVFQPVPGNTTYAVDADVFTVPGGAAGAPAFVPSSVTLNITAVPEPSSMMLVGLGLAAFGLRRRRS